MEATEFKAIFNDVAKAHGFTARSGGWYRELRAALVVLELQKSNFGNYYEMNLKIFIGRNAPSSSAEFKKLVKNQSGDIFRRQPEEYRDTFDLETSAGTEDRRKAIDQMFVDLIDRISTAANSSAEILGLKDEGILHVLPMAEAKLRSC